ncbi:hypothetical protein KFU94_27085 [Chloroflexi bacterium TSY]|nr:hypothetical protein [Chloroflexi bacterium TSY]
MTCAPAFARQVAEMALGLALAAGREIVVGDRAMRANEERYSKEGNVGTFMLYDQPVGFIGYGSLARSLNPLRSCSSKNSQLLTEQATCKLAMSNKGECRAWISRLKLHKL